MVIESQVSRVTDTAEQVAAGKEAPTTAFYWFVAWATTWFAVAVAVTWSGADEHEPSRLRMVIGAQVLIFALAVYVGAGVRRGRRLLGAASLVGAYFFIGLIGGGLFVGGVSPRGHPVPIWVGMAVFYAVSVVTLWVLVRAWMRAEHGVSA